MGAVWRMILVVTALFVTTDSLSGHKVLTEGLAKLVLHVVEQELHECHLMLLTTDLYSPLIVTVLR